MTLDSGLLWAFLLVFVRCSAMMLSSPVFGAQTTPIHIRVLTTMCLSGALTIALRPGLGQPPADLYPFIASIGNEMLAGLLIGSLVSLAFSAFQMAGGLLDLQVGFGASQVLNPATGVPSTLLSQFKYMLAVVVFLSLSGHHVLLRAFVGSYDAMPTFDVAGMQAIQVDLVALVTQSSLLAIQIAAPVAAVGFVVDAALGIVNKAVPQMQVLAVGMPAKIAMGVVALSVALPMMAASVSSAIELASSHLAKLFGGG